MAECKTCNEKCELENASLCNNCWEVESRLERYLNSNKATKKILDYLNLTRSPDATIQQLLLAFRGISDQNEIIMETLQQIALAVSPDMKEIVQKKHDKLIDYTEETYRKLEESE